MKHSFFQRALCIALLVSSALISQAQEMTNDRIEEILEQAPFITMNSREGNVWDFTIEDRGLVIITD